MEKCFRGLIEGNNIQRVLGEIPCDPEVITQLPSIPQAVVWTLIGIGVLIAFFGFLFIVKQKEAEIIERFGKFIRIARAGLNIKIPLIERRVGTLSLRIREMSESVTAKSKDNAFVSVPVKVQFQVIEKEEKKAFYELEDAEDQISSYIVNTVRSKATEMDMNALFASKSIFEEAVENILSEKFSDYGFAIINVLVDDPLPSEEVVMAFNRVISSKREKEAAENEAEALRIMTVANAKAEAESLELKAEAYVNQRDIIAKGLSTALKSFKVGVSEERLLGYLEGIDWRDTIRDASQGKGTTIVIPADMKGDTMTKILAANEAGNNKQ